MTPDWTKMLSPVPDDYQTRIESTLHELKEEPMNKKLAYHSILMVAIIVLALTGTALALGQSLGLLDLFHRDTGLIAQTNAPAAIATALGSAENDQFRLTVREAAYDGNAIRAIALVEAIEKGKYIPMFNGGYDARLDDQTSETLEAYAQRTSRSLLDIGLVEMYTNASPDTTCTVLESRKNDDLILYGELYLHGETPDAVEVTVSICPEDQPLSISFRLQRAEALSKEMLDGPVVLDGCTLQSVTRHDTPFATYMAILYTTDNVVVPFEEGVTYYGTQFGRFAHRQSNCGGMTDASAMSVDDVIAQQKMPCPVCIPGASSALSFPAQWGFELMKGDEAMGLATSAGSNVTELGSNSYTLTMVYQAGSVPEEGLSLIPFSPVKGKMEPVALK